MDDRQTPRSLREDRDSNPGASCPANGFQDRRLRPLGHPPGEHLDRFEALAGVPSSDKQRRSMDGFLCPDLFCSPFNRPAFAYPVPEALTSTDLPVEVSAD